MELYLRDIDFLINNILMDRTVEKLVRARHFLNSQNEPHMIKVQVGLSVNELLMIHELLGDLLSSKGVSKGEINALGKYVESLVDAFSNELEGKV